MRISEYFQLGETQPALDFVDVRTDRDIRVFVDPRPIRTMPGKWGEEAHFLLKSFFGEVLTALRQQDADRVRELLSYLREPYEIHFGFTRRGVRGHGVGDEIGDRLAAALGRSQALRTGVLKDLEDTILMVPGVGPDLISDITANVIRGPLIRYTHLMAGLHGMPMEDTFSGPIWNPTSMTWEDGYTHLPMVGDDRLLLVPKYLARHKLDYDPDVYYRRYLAPHLEAREIDGRTELVRTLKSGRLKVNRTDLYDKYPPHADAIAQWTLEYPQALEVFRNQKVRRTRPPMDHNEVAAYVGTPPRGLQGTVRSGPGGHRDCARVPPPPGPVRAACDVAGRRLVET